MPSRDVLARPRPVPGGMQPGSAGTQWLGRWAVTSLWAGVALVHVKRLRNCFSHLLGADCVQSCSRALPGRGSGWDQQPGRGGRSLCLWRDLTVQARNPPPCAPPALHTPHPGSQIGLEKGRLSPRGCVASPRPHRPKPWGQAVLVPATNSFQTTRKGSQSLATSPSAIVPGGGAGTGRGAGHLRATCPAAV